ncbi:acyl-CoA thioesterase [Thiomicrorhabdus lithotrophica]|uniref:Acyl-CoA thioesterase n=1 Tax=Thiomicrorhabdus lithotrophica TaxID=2949997 RepID=A0ABY8C8W6_9GAMM|nr:acyl-CoA thioesterase [Thiomicrorhabdus lithotrophica]WEJ62395.1 acyl-CoA thioesterase [Thiomicrorhabdus lithotrophica]
MFKLEMKVRDYECDIQGVVNNAVYQNYLEHSRHEFLLENNIDFVALANKGIHLVVVRAELDYKQSLKPGDALYITVELEKESRVKYVFVQKVYRSVDDKLMLQARTLGVALNEKGRPTSFEALENIVS